ncbi:MAG: UDP-2,3-diacylglucosamine diphosphatase [Xanthomonadaceae bacterium]|nr:UDP-2,3-diacylglucosamine diphosphatase [Xanthomonadaceae bacterium]
MTTLFVSDLHLDPARPEITALFLHLLRGEAARADALYILGDLFEAWVGDDDPSEAGAEVSAALRALADAGVPAYFIHGNRDFLVGQDYADRAGLRILPDPAVVSLYGEPVLLMHGDLLCTDDTAYQAFRAQTRDPVWQATFLAQPLAARLAFAAQAREASMARQREMIDGDRANFENVTDVNPAAVAATLARFGVSTLIHGHTHRPAMHALRADGRDCRRIVLGDWYEQGSLLRVSPGRHYDLQALAR